MAVLVFGMYCFWYEHFGPETQPCVVRTRIDGKRIDGKRIEGERIEGERIEGERIEGERIEGEHIEGERIEGKRRSRPWWLFEPKTATVFGNHETMQLAHIVAVVLTAFSLSEQRINQCQIISGC
jgi:hypothetical protein